MGTIAIGDIHGCIATLEALLAEMEFDAADDDVWLVGDLVNRGPGSLEVLRWARDLGDRCVSVLGNHDVHLLGRALGVRPQKRFDRFDEILTAPDRDALIDWLRHRPLLHATDEFTLLHAGLQPAWSFADAEEHARAVEAELRSPGAEALLRDHYNKVDEPLPRALRTFAHMRTCTADGKECSFKGPPEDAPEGCHPWYELTADRAWHGVAIFGHWASLGHRRTSRICSLDTGCAWGYSLTGLRLESDVVTQVRLLDQVERG